MNYNVILFYFLGSLLQQNSRLYSLINNMSDILENDSSEVFTPVSGDAGDSGLLDQSNGATEETDPVIIIF